MMLRSVLRATKHRYPPIVGRYARKQLLRKGRGDPTTRLCLFPRWTTTSELRTLFRVDVETAFRAVGVRRFKKKYFWEDAEERQFETFERGKISVPFEQAAKAADTFGFVARLVDPEPEWDSIPCSIPSVPVAVVLGDIGHGKTTLIDTLGGSAHAETEEGGITQKMRAQTLLLPRDPDALNNPSPPSPHTVDTSPSAAMKAGLRRPARLEASPGGGPGEQSERGNEKRREIESFRLTLLDTPGHEAFDTLRGHATSVADLAIVVVALDRCEAGTVAEALIQAEKFGVEVLFVLSKADIPFGNAELARAVLRRECQRLLDSGLLKTDFSSKAAEALEISCKTGKNLSELVRRIYSLTVSFPSLPVRPVENPCTTPGRASEFAHVSRRVDCLQGVDGRASGKPRGVGIVLDVHRDHLRGHHLTVLMRHGLVLEGDYFVTGTTWGRVRDLWTSDSDFRKPSQCAGPGTAVQVRGIDVKGEVAVDDLFFVLPKERAWRLATYRQRLDTLFWAQSGGPNFTVPWQSDPPALNSRVQMSGGREEGAQRDSDSGLRRSIEEYGTNKKEARIFSEVPIDDFEAPLERNKRLAELFEREGNGPGGDPWETRGGDLSEMSSLGENEEEELWKGKGAAGVIDREDQEDSEETEVEEDFSDSEGESSAEYHRYAGNGEESEDEVDEHEGPGAKKSKRTLPRFDSSETASILVRPMRQDGETRSTGSGGSLEEGYENEEHEEVFTPPQWAVEGGKEGIQAWLRALSRRRRKKDLENFASSSPVAPELTEENDATTEETGEGQEGSGRRGRRSRSGAGRRQTQRNEASSSSENLGGGQERENENAEIEEVLWTDRENWYAQAEAYSKRVMKRWRQNHLTREMERRRQRRAKAELVLEAERVRRIARRLPPLSVPEEQKFLAQVEGEAELGRKAAGRGKGKDVDEGEEEEGEEDVMASRLPDRVPVVPVILKTSSMQSFDLLLDGFKDMEEAFGMRVPVVHGGVGPLKTRDVEHAVVEQHFGYCPVYAFQVEVHNLVSDKAQRRGVKIKKYQVFTDLMEDIKDRCENIQRLRDHHAYVQTLKKRPTMSGL
uniref:Tr-type G domain-containing protein n=1 Tax=Chromera velia CCMP2878 TaxID=1169474 RepID=A0A0G4F1W0_9ALVE|eukprot:Cvel_14650.t1-p1 / transcript=Cvel_14650.t1 / gene=Cvel_14650 / organism=Chromera_velia_CCMP2878 / gene_product=Translation initiation factor IF-2, putative / transcript_product=Translation initiation factor IF-2, putative / location=Cvel_scaffold1049:21353-32617(-) / protein_length=1075 / sequence_SO=supercontig / SO=protein_coding / is_pseudo=false